MSTISTLSKEEKSKYLEELFEFLKLPSVSADSKFSKYMNTTANWLSNELLKSGCDSTKVYETNGHPIVYGEKIINPSYPTILVYGHYDVQPPDPLELWNSPPFEPTIKKTDIHPETYNKPPSKIKPGEPDFIHSGVIYGKEKYISFSGTTTEETINDIKKQDGIKLLNEHN